MAARRNQIGQLVIQYVALLGLLLGMAMVQAHDFGGPSSAGNGDPPPPPNPPCDDGLGCSCPKGPEGHSSDPISYFNGGESVSETDLIVEGLYPIAVTRSYDSHSTYDSPLGYGWSYTHDRRLYEYPDGSVIVRHGCGIRDRYVPSGGGYVAPTGGMLATLVANGDGSWELRYASGDRDFFDTQGRLTATQNSRGDRLELTYDVRGKLPLTGASKSAVDPNQPMVVAYVYRVTRIDERASGGTLSGRYVTFAYDEATGRLTSVEANDGRTVTYTHDTNSGLTKGNLIQVDGIDGIVRAYDYADPNDVHNLTSITEAPGWTPVVNTYDTQDRVIRQEEGSRRIDFNYQIPLTKTVVTRTIRDENGLNPYTSVTTYEFDTTGRITKVLDPLGHEHRYIYNTNKQLQRLEVWQNTAGTLALLQARNWTYDANGRRMTETVGLDGGETITRSWTYDHDWVASEQLVSSAAPTKIFRTEYTFYYAADGRPTNIQSMKRRRDDGSFQTTTYTYDSENRTLTTTLPDGVVLVNEYTGRDLTRNYFSVGGVPVPQLERRFEYDTRGLLTKQWDARNNLTQFAYDDRGRLISATNAVGEQTLYTYQGDLLTEVEIGRTATDGEGQVTKLLYDGYGRRSGVQRKNDAGAFVTYETYARNSEGNVLATTDAIGRTTRYGYDVAGRVASVTDATNQTTQFHYDAAGNRVRVLDPLSRETTFEYDDLNRLIAVVQGGMSPNPRTEITYDAAGNRIQVTDAENHTTTYVYDSLSRLVTMTRPLGQQTQLYYDDRDRVDYLLNARGQRLDFDYEPWGPVSEERHYASVTPTAPLRTITFARDNDGNVTSVSDDGIQAGPIYTVTYDSLSRSLDETIKYVPGGDRVLQRRYDRFGNQRELTFVDGSNLVHTYSYNKLNELTTADLAGSNIAATYLADSAVDVLTMAGGLTRDYGYDSRGLVNAIDVGGSGGAIAQFSYMYDQVARVDTLTDFAGTHDPSYDGLDRLTGITHPVSSGLPLSEAFSYDGVGNRKDPSNSATFQYDANNRLTTASNSIYSSDADGNVQSISGGAAFTHDLLNRLTQFVNGSVTADYLLEPSGRRIKKTVGGQTTWFLWDGFRLLAEYDAAGARIGRYAYLPGAVTPMQFADTNGVYWTHADRLGTVRLLTNSSGTVLWRSHLSAYGEAIVDSDPDGDSQHISFPLRFPGQYADAESGMYYNVMRTYDPTLGRYLEEDPLPSANQYWYADGDPYSGTDPLGLRATIYKYPPNDYSDIPPPPGVPCLEAVFRGGILMGWKPCESCPADEGYGYGYDGWPGSDDDDILVEAGEDFSWEDFAWDLLKPDWTWALGAAGKPLQAGIALGILGRASRGAKLFDREGIATTEHFVERLAQRQARGISERNALDAYLNGRVYYDPVSGNYIRHSSRTAISVVTDSPSGGTAVTVFEGNPSPRWNPVPWRPGRRRK